MMKKMWFLYLLLFTSGVFAQDGITILQSSIVAFDQATCPTGWSQVNATRGRVLVGQGGAANVDALGSPLTARTLGATGGLEYKSGIPAANVAPTSSIPSPTRVLARGVDPSGPTNVNLYNNTGTDSAVGRMPANSNMPPFTTVIFCQKD
ncbi:MAG: hypothetical protein EP319_04880 [Deltaproteobacteria bacterium]|nr:MAG: hypothetical protein EP319_04880 [Deltaproteobacteria bacterium]